MVSPCKPKLSNKYQLGAGTTESIITVILLLTMMLGAFQGLIAYRAKISLNHAVMEAARSGSLVHGQSDVMEEKLAEQLSPLYGGWGTDGARGLAEATVLSATDLGLPPGPNGGAGMQLHILSPTQEAYDAFGETNADGVVEIPNHHLKHLSRAVDPTARVNIQDANLLKIHVTYGYKLTVPIIDKLIAAAGNQFDPNHSAYYSATPPRLPLQSSAVVRMHTAARKDRATLSITDDLGTVTAAVVPPEEREEEEREEEEEEREEEEEEREEEEEEREEEEEEREEEEEEREEEEPVNTESIDVTAETVNEEPVDTDTVECTTSWDDSRYNAEITWNPSTWLNGIETAKNVISDFVDGLFEGVAEQFADLWNLLKDPSVLLDMAEELIRNPQEFIGQIVEEIVSDVERVMNCGPRDIGYVIGRNMNPALAVKVVSRLADITGNSRLARYVDNADPRIICTGRVSFVAGTPVLTSDGLRAIETLVTGDLVATRLNQYDPLVYEPIASTHHRVANGIHLLSTSNGILEVTGEHPFYLHNQGWVTAKHLRSGDVIAAIYGDATVYSNKVQHTTTRVFNLTVDQGKTYFVVPNGGDVANALWVHNRGRQSCWGRNEIIGTPRRIGNRNLYLVEVDVRDPNGGPTTRERRRVYIDSETGRYRDFNSHPPEQRIRPDVYLEPPEGHHWVRQQNGTVFLRRHNTDVPRQQPTADGRGFEDYDGTTRPGANRLLDSGRLASNLGRRPDWPRETLADGTTTRASSAAHHRVPSRVVRDNSVLNRIHRQGIYDFDGADNGVYLPTTPEARAAALADPDWSEPAVIHRGGHTLYSDEVARIAQREIDALEDIIRNDTGKRIDELTDAEFENYRAEINDAMNEIQERTRALLTGGPPYVIDGVLQ